MQRVNLRPEFRSDSIGKINETFLGAIWGLVVIALMILTFGPIFADIDPLYVRTVAPGILAKSPLGRFLGVGLAGAMLWMSATLVGRERFVDRRDGDRGPTYVAIVRSYNEVGESGAILGFIFIARSVALVVGMRMCVLIVAMLLVAHLCPYVLCNMDLQITFVVLCLWSFETSLKKALNRTRK